MLLLVLLTGIALFLWLTRPEIAGDKRGISDAKVVLPDPWPPQLDQRYPELELIDHRGQELLLSSFEGSVLIIEPIGMNCPACLAFSGGHQKGGLDKYRPEVGALSLEEYIADYAPDVRPENPEVVLVQLLLYDLSMKPPTWEHAALWREHFPTNFTHHEVVVPKESLISPQSYDLIPGFQLVDRNFILRSDFTGHRPQNSLHQHLLPRLSELLR